MPWRRRSEIDVGADHADVIEGMREIGERRDVLKSDNATECGVEGDEKNTPRRKAANEPALLLDRDGRVEGRITARRDDRVEDRHNVLGVLNPHITNVNQTTSRADRAASGSASTLLVVPLPVSIWNGARVLIVAHSPLPFQPASRIVDAAVHPLGVEARADRARASRPTCRLSARAAPSEALPVLIGVFAPRPDVSN